MDRQTATKHDIMVINPVTENEKQKAAKKKNQNRRVTIVVISKKIVFVDIERDRHLELYSLIIQ
jgi:ribosomal protein L39E